MWNLKNITFYYLLFLNKFFKKWIFFFKLKKLFFDLKIDFKNKYIKIWSNVPQYSSILHIGTKVLVQRRLRGTGIRWNHSQCHGRMAQAINFLRHRGARSNLGRGRRIDPPPTFSLRMTPRVPVHGVLRKETHGTDRALGFSSINILSNTTLCTTFPNIITFFPTSHRNLDQLQRKPIFRWTLEPKTSLSLPSKVTASAMRPLTRRKLEQGTHLWVLIDLG